MILSGIVAALEKLGVANGDVVYAASNTARFGVPEAARAQVKAAGPSILLASHVATLRHVVGLAGTLVMPTFSYSACRGDPFDPRRTPSVVGALTDYFWRMPGVERSAHPIFSAAALGPEASALLHCGDLDCFGTDSLFARLQAMDATYLMYGVQMGEGATHVYFSEQRAGVRYRIHKTFEARLIDEHGASNALSVPYFVRSPEYSYRDAWQRLQGDAIAEGIVRTIRLGAAPLLAYRASAMDALIQRKLDENPNYLIELM